MNQTMNIEERARFMRRVEQLKAFGLSPMKAIEAAQAEMQGAV